MDSDQKEAQQDAPAPQPSPGDHDMVLDPHNRAVLVGALGVALRGLGIESRQHLPTAQRGTFLVTARGGGLTQQLALCKDPDRPGCWAWWWLWADGLRGEGPLTPEYLCPGEDVDRASTRLARVLGVTSAAV